jgi:hypothetical protein
MTAAALRTYCALMVANFGYQALNEQLWQVAGERSFFQGVAIATLLCVLGLWGTK